MALSEDQKIFIKKKVKSLGSYEKVKSCYYRDDLVSKFAAVEANKLYSPVRKERRRRR